MKSLQQKNNLKT